MDNLDSLIDYESFDEIDFLYFQCNNCTFKQDFYSFNKGDKVAFIAFNYNNGTYTLGINRNDPPEKWLSGKIQVSFSSLD